MSSSECILAMSALLTALTFFWSFLPVYLFAFGSHSSSIRVSPAFSPKSASRISEFFFPLNMSSKNSGQHFFLTSVISHHPQPQLEGVPWLEGDSCRLLSLRRLRSRKWPRQGRNRCISRSCCTCLPQQSPPCK